MAFARQNWLIFPSTDRMFLIQAAPLFRRKTRVRNSRHNPSGRLACRGQFRSVFTPSFCRYTYQTVPGRSVWLSRDPIEEGGSLNLYSFTWNFPVGAIDILGREPKNECVVVTLPSDIPADDIPMQSEKLSVNQNKDKHGWTVIEIDNISDGNQQLKNSACKCIKELNILGHGNKGLQLVGNGKAALEYKNGTASGLDLFKDLKTKFCKPCTVYLRGCSAGGGQNGKALLKAIANATGCTAKGWINSTTEITPYQGLPASGIPFIGAFNGPNVSEDPD